MKNERFRLDVGSSHQRKLQILFMFCWRSSPGVVSGDSLCAASSRAPVLTRDCSSVHQSLQSISTAREAAPLEPPDVLGAGPDASADSCLCLGVELAPETCLEELGLQAAALGAEPPALDPSGHRLRGPQGWRFLPLQTRRRSAANHTQQPRN